MWTRQLFGTDIYHLVFAFVIYSILGWFIESVYMSFCNKKITNRGFAKGPFCPIYGFGAVSCYILLNHLEGQYLKLYIIGAILATTFEYIVGNAMIWLFGELWWDYNEKPFNYKGIICLESTIAWGFYAIGIVQVLQQLIYRFIDNINHQIGVPTICIILSIVTVDYIIQLTKIFNIDVKEKRRRLIEKCQTFLARF